VKALPNKKPWIWCDFYRASSLICENKMPTRCNKGFYCRSYCLLNMFQAPLFPSSGAQEYCTVVAACGFQVVGLLWRWELCVQFAGCCSSLQTGHICNKKPLLHLVGILFPHKSHEFRGKCLMLEATWHWRVIKHVLQISEPQKQKDISPISLYLR